MTIFFRKHGDPPKIYCDIEAEGRYLDLEQLGKVLSQLYELLPGMGGTFYVVFVCLFVCLSLLSSIFTGTLQSERKFHIESLICGQPNLLVVPPGMMYHHLVY